MSKQRSQHCIYEQLYGFQVLISEEGEYLYFGQWSLDKYLEL